jgi:hypothetical protein
MSEHALVLDPEAVEPAPGRDRFCAACRTKPPGRDCCWFVEDTAGAEPEPGELVPVKPWREWSAEARFLVTTLLELFHGAAEEWELLCRLPWTRGRLSNYVFDAERHGPEAALHYPVMREKDALGRGTRYMVTDLARASYEAHRREFMTWLLQERALDGDEAAPAGAGAGLTPIEENGPGATTRSSRRGERARAPPMFLP